MLLTLVVRNWLPSTHRTTVGHDIAKLIYLIGTKKNVNFGDLIYSRVCDYIGKIGVAKRLAYLGLIYNRACKSDSLPCCMGALRPSVKIFDNKHHVDDVRGVNMSASSNLNKDVEDESVPDESESVVPDEVTNEDATLNTSVPNVVLCTIRKKLQKELGKISKHMEFLSGYKSRVESILQLLPKAEVAKSAESVQNNGASGSGGAIPTANQETTANQGNTEVADEAAVGDVSDIDDDNIGAKTAVGADNIGVADGANEAGK